MCGAQDAASSEMFINRELGSGTPGTPRRRSRRSRRRLHRTGPRCRNLARNRLGLCKLSSSRRFCIFAIGCSVPLAGCKWHHLPGCRSTLLALRSLFGHLIVLFGLVQAVWLQPDTRQAPPRELFLLRIHPRLLGHRCLLPNSHG